MNITNEYTLIDVLYRLMASNCLANQIYGFHLHLLLNDLRITNFIYFVKCKNAREEKFGSAHDCVVLVLYVVRNADCAVSGNVI